MHDIDAHQPSCLAPALGGPADMPPRSHRCVRRIELDSQAVIVRGETLQDVWWRGCQWAVTAHGIEHLDGTYAIEASRLAEQPDHPWPLHMAGKAWVDVDEFATAWMVALLLHGKAGKADPALIRAMLGRLPPRRDARGATGQEA